MFALEWAKARALTQLRVCRFYARKLRRNHVEIREGGASGRADWEGRAKEGGTPEMVEVVVDGDKAKEGLERLDDEEVMVSPSSPRKGGGRREADFSRSPFLHLVWSFDAAPLPLALFVQEEKKTFLAQSPRLVPHSPPLAHVRVIQSRRECGKGSAVGFSNRLGCSGFGGGKGGEGEIDEVGRREARKGQVRKGWK